MPMCKVSRNIPSDFQDNRTKIRPLRDFPTRDSYITFLRQGGYEVVVGGTIPDKVDTNVNILYGGFVFDDNKIWFPQVEERKKGLLSRMFS